MQFGWSGSFAAMQPVSLVHLRPAISRFLSLLSKLTSQRRLMLFLCCWLAWTAVFLRLERRLRPKEKL
jgi:hypothetical protein